MLFAARMVTSVIQERLKSLVLEIFRIKKCPAKVFPIILKVLVYWPLGHRLFLTFRRSFIVDEPRLDVFLDVADCRTLSHGRKGVEHVVCGITLRLSQRVVIDPRFSRERQKRLQEFSSRDYIVLLQSKPSPLKNLAFGRFSPVIVSRFQLRVFFRI